jgi:hypothetical protein
MTMDMFRLSFPYSWLIIGIREEKIEYTKIRSPKSKDRQQNAQKKKDKQWSRKHYTKPGVNSGTPDG